MPRCIRVWAVLMLALGVPSCTTDRYVLGPTPLDEGVILYLHANYAGPSQAVNINVPNLSEVDGPCEYDEDDPAYVTWNDCISSVRVLPGWGATLYQHEEYRGRSLDVTADVADLKALAGPCRDSFNDCATSIRVYRLQ